MKKILLFISMIALAACLVGCDSMDYSKAMTLYDKGEYEQAQTMFEQLGDYKDSADMATKCHVAAVDELLQGKWMHSATLIGEMGFSFDDGELESYIGDTVVNSGTYRIDADEKSIYVWYEYDISYNPVTEDFDKTKNYNDEEIKIATYSYKDGKLTLSTEATGDKMTKE